MKNSKIIILVLVIAVGVMVVAYAALQASLNISGTANIASTWGPIYISSCSCTATKSMDALHKPIATCGPADTGETDNHYTKIKIEETMILPGDEITCTFNTVNEGTLLVSAPTFSYVGTNDYFSVTGQNATCMKGKTGNTNGTGTFEIKIKYLKESPANTNRSVIVTPVFTQASSCVQS